MEIGYPGDSFHTLSQGEQLGLVVLSIFLWGVMLALVSRMTGVLWALVILWTFVWLSPQVYYLYYQMIFDGLPWQVVIQTPPGPLQIVQILTFQAEQTLSAHGKGVLGWSLIALAAWRRLRKHGEPTT